MVMKAPSVHLPPRPTPSGQRCHADTAGHQLLMRPRTNECPVRAHTCFGGTCPEFHNSVLTRMCCSIRAVRLGGTSVALPPGSFGGVLWAPALPDYGVWQGGKASVGPSRPASGKRWRSSEAQHCPGMDHSWSLPHVHAAGWPGVPRRWFRARAQSSEAAESGRNSARPPAALQQGGAW